MSRGVLTMGIDASRESADNDAAGRRSEDGFVGRESDTRASAERAEPLPTREERMAAQRQAHRAADDAYAARGSDAGVVAIKIAIEAIAADAGAGKPAGGAGSSGGRRLNRAVRHTGTAG